ncbi:MAG TPA: ABC transporter permease [Thermoanaerobaculia bacterium]|jgi:cell division transport system permease protein
MPRDAEIPRSTIGYFFREALRRIWVSKRTSLVAVAMIAMSLLILGAFLLLSENLSRAVTRWQGSSRVTVYLDADATPAQTRDVELFLTAHRDFGPHRLVTKEEALARFKSYFTNLDEVVGELEENPFPASFECNVTPRVAQSSVFSREVADLRAIPGVDQVQLDWDWVRRLRRLVDVVNAAGFVAGGILAIAAAFTIANVIRLTMMLYREEIEIMRLVGATERIIRGPFLIEGLLQGTLGAIVAIALLFGSYELARRLIPPASSLLWGFLFAGFLPWQKIVGLLGGGMVAGWVGSWISVRERTEEAA